MTKKSEIIRKHFSEMGKKGGASKLKMYGKDYFARIGRIGNKKRWDAYRLLKKQLNNK